MRGADRQFCSRRGHSASGGGGRKGCVEGRQWRRRTFDSPKAAKLQFSVCEEETLFLAKSVCVRGR